MHGQSSDLDSHGVVCSVFMSCAAPDAGGLAPGVVVDLSTPRPQAVIISACTALEVQAEIHEPTFLAGCRLSAVLDTWPDVGSGPWFTYGQHSCSLAAMKQLAMLIPNVKLRLSFRRPCSTHQR